LLLQFLAKELRGSRLMLLGTYRDVELRRQHPLAQALGELNRENLSQRVLLRGLTENDVRRFVEVTAGTSPPDALVKAVYKETEGNPFFVEEVVRMLIERGVIVSEDERWVATGEIAGVEIPESLHGLLLARIDQLPDTAKRSLRIAAVIGRQFPVRVLERVVTEAVT